jgi:hypothetical protein
MELKCGNEIDLKYYPRSKNIIVDLFYTMVICTAIALVLAMINPSTNFFVYLIISQSFGLTIC